MSAAAAAALPSPDVNRLCANEKWKLYIVLTAADAD